jgi:hypothetical protein
MERIWKIVIAALSTLLFIVLLVPYHISVDHHLPLPGGHEWSMHSSVEVEYK